MPRDPGGTHSFARHERGDADMARRLQWCKRICRNQFGYKCLGCPIADRHDCRTSISQIGSTRLRSHSYCGGNDES